MFAIKYGPDAAAELRALRAFERMRLLDAIGKHLKEAPATVIGKKKRIDLGGGDFIYQLRVGDYRVFYDVDQSDQVVVVRHVRRKGRKTTGEVL